MSQLPSSQNQKSPQTQKPWGSPSLDTWSYRITVGSYSIQIKIMAENMDPWLMAQIIIGSAVSEEQFNSLVPGKIKYYLVFNDNSYK